MAASAFLVSQGKLDAVLDDYPASAKVRANGVGRQVLNVAGRSVHALPVGSPRGTRELTGATLRPDAEPRRDSRCGPHSGFE